MKKRSIVIHGHFYQPPREDPWTNKVERQPSAYPSHDWNERINGECYSRNANAPIQDGSGKIVGLVNNYEFINFNFGPTLLSWMSENAPETLVALVEGDRLSRQRCGGHGNAIAQIYNHMIMPLAQDRDKKTQVLWGIEDFRFRFGRDPEGMHLSETAVDTASLEALADAGIKFTLLAPRQARRWRRLGEQQWQTDGGIDPSRAYLCRLPSGKSIALFFYDGPISQAVAFEHLLNSGEGFLARLKTGFSDKREHHQLVHIATDGESYGHHHKFGEMCLSWVVDKLWQDAEIELTNYGQFLEAHPAEYEVEIHERSSWSCAHGIERWRSDCGCNTRGSGQQRWRAPLRQALDQLRARLDQIFESEGSKYFTDAWKARDSYVKVLLDPCQTEAFVKDHCLSDLGEEKVQQALDLLEMQRQAMLMYTSCGWFFEEISEIEPVQNLLYATRALELARQFSQDDLEGALTSVLATAPSNVPEIGDGRGVWEKIVKPRALASELNALINSPLSSQGEVELLCHLLSQCQKTRVAVDQRIVRNRVLNVYARLKAEGPLDPLLHAAFVCLAKKLNLSESLLGWNRDGNPDTVTVAGCRRKPTPRCVHQQLKLRKRSLWRH